MCAILQSERENNMKRMLLLTGLLLVVPLVVKAAQAADIPAAGSHDNLVKDEWGPDRNLEDTDLLDDNNDDDADIPGVDD